MTLPCASAAVPACVSLPHAALCVCCVWHMYSNALPAPGPHASDHEQDLGHAAELEQVLLHRYTREFDRAHKYTAGFQQGFSRGDINPENAWC
jgi:hypothetical protein